MQTYELVNPFIKGDLKTIQISSSSLNAAKQIWNNLSTLFSNNVPNFSYTLKSIDGQLHHFNVSEVQKGDDIIFKIVELSPKKADEDILDQRVKHLKEGNFDILKDGRKSFNNNNSDSELDTETDSYIDSTVDSNYLSDITSDDDTENTYSDISTDTTSDDIELSNFDDNRYNHTAIQEGGNDVAYNLINCNNNPFYNCLNQVRFNTPIYYWWYTPLIYNNCNNILNSCFIPTFKNGLTPYLEIETTNWYLY